MKTAPIVAVGVVLYLATFLVGRHGWTELHGGMWLVAHLCMLYLMSYLGDFGGRGWIGHPWGSIVVALASLGLYGWGVASGVRYLTERPERIERVAGDAAGDADVTRS